MSDDRAQIIDRLVEEATPARYPYLYDGTLEAVLTRTPGAFTLDEAAAHVTATRDAHVAQVRGIIEAVYDSIAAHTLREAAGDYRTTLLVLRYNGATIEQGPANWMDDRALELERKQARRG